jgi:hypothetical protein
MSPCYHNPQHLEKARFIKLPKYFNVAGQPKYTSKILEETHQNGRNVLEALVFSLGSAH